MNYCDISKNYLDYVVDDAPEKRNKYTPGKHTFSLGPLFVQTVNLEAGRTYYLAAEKDILLGVRSLRFRTYDNFIKWTKNAKQIEFTGEKCDGWSGCPMQDVIE